MGNAIDLSGIFCLTTKSFVMTQELDFAKMKVSELFRRIFLPTLMGMLAISAVTAVDGIFVGHGVGGNGIAAINISVPLLMLFTGIGLMVGAGSSVTASVLMSHGKPEEASRHVTQAISLVTIVTVVPTVVIMIFPDATLRLLGVSPTLLPMAREYLLWFAPGLTFQMWTAVGLFAIRLDGSPRYAMMCSVTTAVLNTVLDWLFIFPMGWGLTGAAVASTISIVVGGVMALWFLSRTAKTVKVVWRRDALRGAVRNVAKQCGIGSSALLAEATMAMLMFMGNQVFMKYLGDDGVGAFGIACYYMPFVFMIGNAIAQSAQPIISYNYGLGTRQRVRSAEHLAAATAIGCGSVVTLLFVFCPKLLVGLFVDLQSVPAQIAVEGFPVYAAAFVAFVLNLTFVGYFQSIERIAPATVFAILRGLVFLVPSFLLLPCALQTVGVWLALAVSEILTLAVIAIYYLAVERRR